jgi:transcriptional regulator
MYLPTLFKEERPEILLPFIQEYPFGLLITIEDQIAQGNHLPWSLVGEQLHAHIPRANPLYQHLRERDSIEVLIVFQGPQAYVTPSWYPSKKEHGQVVPTWNYAVVHVRGTLRMKDDSKWLLEHLNHLTNYQEKTRNSEWQVSDAPEEFIKTTMKVLVGLEVQITSIVGKFKLSQNRQDQDRQGVIDHLLRSSKQEDVELANLTNHIGIIGK